MAVFPEGFKGLGKPYADRYKLQRFGRGGFVSAALRAQVPIIPDSDCRLGGDLPADRQGAGARPDAGPAVLPDYAAVSVAWVRSA